MNTHIEYLDFLRSKRLSAKPSGFDPEHDIHLRLFDWQADIVRWALRLGKAAIFADCGLGKTFMQVEWAAHVCDHMQGDVLILAPLAVANQTKSEAARLGIDVTVCRTQADVLPGINITNYEMLHRFAAGHFVGVVLDESSILKSFMGKTKRAIIEAFRNTPFKLACTATPAPNDHMELGNHADFLDVPGAGEMLSIWFCNDQSNAGKYRLKQHAEKDYWRWVATWAVSLSRPSDLGYSDAGFELPALEVIPEVVRVDLTKEAGGNLLRLPEMTATNIHKEQRLTVQERALRAAELVFSHELGPWVVWCNTDYEADALRAAMPFAVELRGSEAVSVKERKLADFTEGRIRVLITKPTIAGYGLNWQHCRRTILSGLSYSYEQQYQAIRRFWRFGQSEPVKVHLVHSETEGAVYATFERKRREHERMKEAMVSAIAETGLNAAQARRQLAPVAESLAKGRDWTLRMGDCCRSIEGIEDDSVGLTVTSPPFENLYIYSDSEADMGNSVDSDEFFRHFGYLIPELLRVTIPGRLAVIHCKDLPTYLNRDGASGLRDFPGDIIRAFVSAGWDYHSRVTIWKCPVTERERTNTNGLLHKTVCRDSSQIRQGMADFLVVFRKPPIPGSNLSAKPIVRPEGFTAYVGDPELDPRTTSQHPSPFARKKHASDPSIDIWRRYAEPVWWDVDQQRVLNYEIARAESDEKHICPLQLDVIARSIQMWSDPGDLVLDPFNGIGSTGVEAIRARRRYVGIELKPSYFGVATRFLSQAEREAGQRTLFDLIEERSEVVA
ncbi:DNA methyltransferase [Singulisphaera sp. PoT]|uniref:DNA methyltransferase n=1 Tax=Singulisphaera sp. PoT TaxID=3411797 RepID=UPI003BF4712E